MRCAKMNAAMRLMAILLLVTASAWGQTWTTGTITYDGAGNITVMGADTFVYDSAGRLVKGTADQQRSGGANRQEYSYDGFGNRKGTNTFGTPCVGACAPSDLTVSATTNQISNHSAAYENGNMTALDGTTFSYDGAGMLAEQIGPNSSIDWRYVYTADDERIATFTGSGNWRFTVRDVDGKVLREFIASQVSGTTTWTWDQDHVYREGLLLATISPAGQQQFHLDHLGTPRLVTNASGMQTGIHSYYPFGDELVLAPTENPVGRLKFTGHERDDNAANGNSLDYMHARFYSSTVGRFLTLDSLHANLRRPQSWNRYSYVRNSPEIYTDPSGLQEQIGSLPSNGIPNDSTLDRFDQMVRDFLSFHWALNAVKPVSDFGEWMVKHPYKFSYHALNAAVIVLQPEFAPLEEGIGEGGYFVYEAVNEAGDVIYVGITTNLERRAIEHLAEKGISINAIEGASNLTRLQARGIEQALIEGYGLGGKSGQIGQLLNKINSVARLNPNYAAATEFGKAFLLRIGYTWR